MNVPVTRRKAIPVIVGILLAGLVIAAFAVVKLSGRGAGRVREAGTATAPYMVFQDAYELKNGGMFSVDVQLTSESDLDVAMSIEGESKVNAYLLNQLDLDRFMQMFSRKTAWDLPSPIGEDLKGNFSCRVRRPLGQWYLVVVSTSASYPVSDYLTKVDARVSAYLVTRPGR